MTMSTIAEAPAGHHAWWTVEQLAERYQMPEHAIRTLIRRKDLPGKKVGRSWRVSAAAVRAYERT